MNGGKSAGGYTVVETMIFLAITGVLFAAAFSFIANKQVSAEFNRATRDFQSQLQDVTNDVATGFYPGAGDFTCTQNGINPTFNNVAPANPTGVCIFTGKILHFEKGANSFNIYSTVGLKQQLGIDVTKLEDARIRVVAKEPTYSPIAKDITTSGNLGFGLNVTKVYYSYSGTDTDISAIGLFSTFTPTDPTSGDALSGATVTQVKPITSPAIGALAAIALTDHPGFAGLVDAPNSGPPPINSGLASPDKVVICTHGGNGKPAAFVIGNGGGGTTVEMHIGMYVNCP
ncbi:MAG: hypothetical protein JWS12_415 [Candidatus Saccharibacteria bacterium]|nr:hypothetical protein [Candidatus Saccharibacteria bacterium]